MVIFLNTVDGKAYHFETRKEAGAFAGVTQPTLRKWLSNPFFLYKTFIITETRNGKAKETKKMLDKWQREAKTISG